eukprot:scaffold4672_cov58-Cylindrotheca_fusiformis.AAC.1
MTAWELSWNHLVEWFPDTGIKKPLYQMVPLECYVHRNSRSSKYLAKELKESFCQLTVWVTVVNNGNCAQWKQQQIFNANSF